MDGTILETLKKLVEGQTMLTDAVAKPKKKQGSELTQKDFKYFGAVSFNANAYDGFEYGSSEAVQQLITEYCTLSSRLYEEGKVDEKVHLQPRSFMLCQSLFAVLLPDIFQELKFYRKGSNSTELDFTHYSTTLIADMIDVRIIIGEADIAVVFNGHCIFVWEDKAINAPLGFQQQSQILVEVKAMCEHLYSVFGEYPELFCGILTNGTEFSVAQMRRGIQQKFRLSASCQGKDFCHLLAHSIRESGKIAQFIDDHTWEVNKQTLSTKRGAEDFDENDEEYQQDSDDQDINKRPPRKKIVRKDPPRSSAGAGAGAGASAGGVSSSSSSVPPSGAQPKKKSNHESSSHCAYLSMENVFLHDLYFPRHGICT